MVKVANKVGVQVSIKPFLEYRISLIALINFRNVVCPLGVMNFTHHGWSRCASCTILIKSHLPAPCRTQRHKSAKIAPHCANHSTSTCEQKVFGGTRVFDWQLARYMFSVVNRMSRGRLSKWSAVIQLGPAQFSSLSSSLIRRNIEDEQALVNTFFCVPVQLQATCQCLVGHKCYWNVKF